MPARLEIGLKSHLTDAEGDGVRKKASDYFDIPLESVRVVQILTFDIDLTPENLEQIRTEPHDVWVFTNAQAVSVVMVALGLILLVILQRLPLASPRAVPVVLPVGE